MYKLEQDKKIRLDIEYRPDFCEEIIRLGALGKFKPNMAASLGVSIKRFNSWLSDPKNPEFKKAFELAMTHCQGYWEEMVQQGTKGVLPKFNSQTAQFILKNNFKDDYSDTQKIEFRDTQSKTDEELDEQIQSLLIKTKNTPESNSGSPAEQC